MVNDVLGRLLEALTIKRLRERGGVAKLSRLTGYSEGQISNVLNGKTKISDRFINIVSSSLGISEKWLLTGEGEMFQRPPDVTDLEYVFPPKPGETADDNEKIVYAALKRLHGWDVEEVIKSLTALPRSARMKILAQMFEAIEKEDEKKREEEEE